MSIPRCYSILHEQRHSSRPAARLKKPSPSSNDPSSALFVAIALFRKMQIIAQPLPPKHLLHGETRVPVRQRQEEVPAGRGRDEHDNGRKPETHEALPGEALARRDEVPRLRPRLPVLERVVVKDELDQGAGYQARSKVRGEIVV